MTRLNRKDWKTPPGPFACEIVDDLIKEFRGSATLDELHEWFGDDRVRLRNTLNRLTASGRVTKINCRFYASAAIKVREAA